MNRALLGLMDDTLRIGTLPSKGNGEKIMDTLPIVLDSKIKQSMVDLDNDIPLRYIGWSFISPKEEIEILSTKFNGKKVFDLADNSMYSIKLLFSFKNDNISIPMFLPYSDGNVITIGGTKYGLVNVVTDTVITPEDDKVFVKVGKDKLYFKSFLHPISINGKNDNITVVESDFLKTDSYNIKDILGKVRTPSIIYLLGKYGFRGTFKKFHNCDVGIHKENDDIDFTNNVTFSSMFSKNKKFKGRKHDIMISLPFNDYSEGTLQIIIGFFYIIDSVFIKDEVYDAITSFQIEDELIFWKTILGKIVFKGNYTTVKLLGEMGSHFDYINNYVDNDTVQKLKSIGVGNVRNIYDLISYLCGNFNYIITTSEEFNLDASNKYIDMVYYILYNTTSSFNRVINNINRKQKRGKVEIRDIRTIFSLTFSSRQIYRLTSKGNLNLAVDSIDCSNDLPYHKVTGQLSLQNTGNGVFRQGIKKFPASARDFNENHYLYGTIHSLPSGAPTGLTRMNIFAEYDDNGKLLVSPTYLKKMTKIGKKLRGEK